MAQRFAMYYVVTFTLFVAPLREGLVKICQSCYRQIFICFEYDMVTDIGFKERRKWPGLYVWFGLVSLWVFPPTTMKKYYRTFFL